MRGEIGPRRAGGVDSAIHRWLSMQAGDDSKCSSKLHLTAYNASVGFERYLVRLDAGNGRRHHALTALSSTNRGSCHRELGKSHSPSSARRSLAYFNQDLVTLSAFDSLRRVTDGGDLLICFGGGCTSLASGAG